jgi:hypothetical protein
MLASKANKPHEVAVGEHLFHVRKYRALPSARISGNLVSTIAPLLGGAGSLFDEESNKNVLDSNLSELLPELAEALAKVDGDKLEKLLRELLIDEGCISFDGDLLTQSVLDELFCGDLFGLLELAVKVCKLNFETVFTMLGNRFGIRAESEKASN